MKERKAEAAMASILCEKEEEEDKKKKKRKTKKTKESLKELKTLGRQLLSSTTHINNLPLLLAFVSPQYPPQHVLEALLSLHSFFAPLLPDLPPSSSSSSSSSSSLAIRQSSSFPNNNNNKDEEAQLIYRTWLRSKFDQFVSSLFDVLLSPLADDALREVALDTLMELVKSANGGRFHSAIYHRLLLKIVNSMEPIDILRELLVSKYFKYLDIRYFTYISLEKLATNLQVKDISDNITTREDKDRDADSRASMELSIQKTHSLLSHVPPLKEDSDNEMWSGSGFLSKEDEPKELSQLSKTDDKQPKSEKNSNGKNLLSASSIAKKMKLKFTKAWISFLRLPLPLEVYKEVLVTLHEAVIPHLSSPIMLCDFLTRSYDIGGVVSVMALSSLFILMTQHGLEYPNFYEKLYALLVPSIFMAKHRAKFFQLLDSCLKSPLLPAYLAAAFAKKLSRLALAVPPSGALVIIALVHNLLRRHPSINCLVHREDGNDSADNDSEARSNDVENANTSGAAAKTSPRKSGIDYFGDEESNPAKSNALRSSLWEIDTLRHHYCPPVSRFVLSLENDLTVRAKTTEIAIKDFSSGSYATIFGEEIKRRVKQVPLAIYSQTSISLFSESDFPGWTFEYNERNDEIPETGIVETLEGTDHNSAKRQRIECL